MNIPHITVEASDGVFDVPWNDLPVHLIPSVWELYEEPRRIWPNSAHLVGEVITLAGRPFLVKGTDTQGPLIWGIYLDTYGRHHYNSRNTSMRQWVIRDEIYFHRFNPPKKVALHRADD